MRKRNFLRVLSLAMIALFAVTTALAEDSKAPVPPSPPANPPANPDAPSTKPDKGGPAKFYGTISAVDATAKTITIDGQTYHVVGESQMTKASDGSAATLTDAEVGQPARGSYTKTTDGTMNITKVRFGKKSGGGGKSGKSGGKKKSEAATQPQS